MSDEIYDKIEAKKRTFPIFGTVTMRTRNF